MKLLHTLTEGFIKLPNFLNYVLSLGEPDPPRKLEVTEMTKNSATLAWLPPLRDGGAKIDGYIISYREEDQPADRWTEYSVVKDLSLIVTGLKEGKKYKFRVAARNAVGVSLPREAEGVYEAKEQLCELFAFVFCVWVFWLHGYLFLFSGFLYASFMPYDKKKLASVDISP